MALLTFCTALSCASTSTPTCSFQSASDDEWAVRRLNGNTFSQGFLSFTIHCSRNISYVNRRFNKSSTVHASSENIEAQSPGNIAEQLKPGDGDEGDLPTMEEIIEVARENGLRLEKLSFGPWFEINVFGLQGKKESLGRANGFVIFWTDGWVLHLESILLKRETGKEHLGNFYGAGFLVGAAALRYGVDCNCQKAELLAINDDDGFHSKLVRYYSRLGFKVVRELSEEGWQDILHRISWGGVGTLMEGCCSELLRKWAKALRSKKRYYE